MSCAARCEASLGRGQYSHAAMRASLIALTAALTLFAAGCGDDGPKKPTGEEAKVIAAYNAANTALREGDFAKACAYHTVELVKRLIADTKTENCQQAFATIRKNLEKANKDPAVRQAIMSDGPDEARIDGNRALVKFDKPTGILKKAFPETADQTGTAELHKTADGKWLIATFTVAD